MVAVFWTGLAVWLLFTIAPLRMVLGLVPRRRRWATAPLPPPLPFQSVRLHGAGCQPLHDPLVCAGPAYSTVTGGLSYQETLGRGQRQGLDDHYTPEVGWGWAGPCVWGVA